MAEVGVEAFGATARRGAPPPSAEGASPRPVTRGETKAAHIDWLNTTFEAPTLSPEGFIALLGRMLGRPLQGDEGRGMLGFERSIKLIAHHGSEKSAIGCLAFGGESQRGRWLLQLTGFGCQFVTDWEGLRSLLEDLDAKLTRVDIAVDFLQGEHTVDDAVAIHQMGGFTGRGNAPSTRVDGDWFDGKQGRTFYVGKAQNGKMLRVYEKGRQLGDADSEWTRFEVQLGNRDRVIPFEVLTEPDAYFAGAYPALEALIEDAAAVAIPTTKTEGVVTIAHLAYHLKRCYGKVVSVLTKHFGATDSELIEELRISAVPKRLNPSSLEAGVSWADVIAQSKKAIK